MQKLYTRFMDGTPEYLARHYWWAYLWRPAVRFFDLPPVANAILLGQYRSLAEATIERCGTVAKGRVLQLSCVYGRVTPMLARHLNGRELHVTDVAGVQLETLQRKLALPHRVARTRMNAEALGYASRSFDTVILFFLMHELPEEARHRALSEALRVLAPSGHLLVTDYAPLPTRHPLYRLYPYRWLQTRLEPFLDSHWRESYPERLADLARIQGRSLGSAWHHDLFDAFYRVSDYQVD